MAQEQGTPQQQDTAPQQDHAFRRQALAFGAGVVLGFGASTAETTDTPLPPEHPVTHVAPAPTHKKPDLQSFIQHAPQPVEIAPASTPAPETPAPVVPVANKKKDSSAPHKSPSTTKPEETPSSTTPSGLPTMGETPPAEGGTPVPEPENTMTQQEQLIEQFRTDFFYTDGPHGTIYGNVHSTREGETNQPDPAYSYDADSNTLLIASFSPKAEDELAIEAYQGDEIATLTIDSSTHPGVDPILSQISGHIETDVAKQAFVGPYGTSFGGLQSQGPQPSEAVDGFSVVDGKLSLEKLPSYEATTQKACDNARASFKDPNQPHQIVDGDILVPYMHGGPGQPMFDVLTKPSAYTDTETNITVFVTANATDPDHITCHAYRNTEFHKFTALKENADATSMDVLPIEGAPQYEAATADQGDDFTATVNGQPQKFGNQRPVNDNIPGRVFDAQIVNGQLTFVPATMK